MSSAHVSTNVSQKSFQEEEIPKIEEIEKRTITNDFPEIRRSLRIIFEYYSSINHVRDRMGELKENDLPPSPKNSYINKY